MKMIATAGTVTVFVSLLALRGALLQVATPTVGLPVIVTHPCKPIWDASPVLVRYGLDHSSSIDGVYLPVEGDLRREVGSIMASRWERVVYLTADERLTYREVSALISDLENDDPALHVALLTKHQIDERPRYFIDFC